MKKCIKLLISPIRLFSIKYFQYCYNKIWKRILSKQVLKLYRKENPDCISCQDAFAAAALKTIRSKIDCSVVLTMHTYFGLENALDCVNNKLQERIYNRNLEFELSSLEVADTIIAVDKRILNHVQDTIKNQSNKIRIRTKTCVSIENFTNTEVFSPSCDEEKRLLREKYEIPEDRFVIVCARRLVEKNGVIYAINAMERLDNSYMLVVAGDGPQQSIIRERIKESHLNDRIKMLGSINPDKIVELYKLSDCSVVPSITVNGLQEATSISALEAMSCSLPTIASRIGGLIQLIDDDVNGFLVDEKNADQIASKIILLRDSETNKRISDSARSFVIDNHSYIQGAKQYLEYFMS